MNINEIHVIAKGARGIGRVKETIADYTSGSWVVSVAKADSLVGGTLFIHEHQKQRAYHGGTIIGFEVEGGRITFRYAFSQEVRAADNRPDLEWAQEKAYWPKGLCATLDPVSECASLNG